MQKVSVIVTTYNSEKTIARALESVFAQTGRNTDFAIETIVIDDCSVDQTCEILKTFPIDVFISNPINSGGPNMGRNKGLEICTGNCFIFLDHDDEWVSDRIISQLKYLNYAPVISCGYEIIELEINKNKIKSYKKAYNSFSFFEENATFLAKLSRSKKSQNVYLGTLMISSKLKNILFETFYGMCDYDWILRILQNNATLKVNQDLLKRHVFGTNLSLNEIYRMNDFNNSKKILLDYKNKYPEKVKKGLKSIYGSMGRYYYLIGNLSKSRSFFLKSKWNAKNILYLLSTFYGREYILKKYKVFG